jgi:predicted peptidase
MSLMKGFRLLFIPLLGLASLALAVHAAEPAGAPAVERGFLNRTFKGADGREVKYSLFVPHDYSPDRPVPTILFLHGLGQTGTDGQRQARVGLGRAIRERESTFPFLVVFPQAQKFRPTIVDTWFPDRPDGARALAILDEVKKQFTTDPKRNYLTGLSMGGFGTWAMAAAFPDKWAAIAPVCGGFDPESVDKVKDVPCWCFHGDRDTAVKVDQSRRMVSALKRIGVAPEYTEYEGVGHNCWDRAYGTDKLYQWLLQHQLK